MSDCATIERSECADTLLLERMQGLALSQRCIGFLLGRTARWVSAAEDGFVSSTGLEPLDDVYAAHLFVPGSHLDARWTRTPEGGRLTVVREVDGPTDEPGPRRFERGASTRQLLWGTTHAGAPAGWTRLSAARVGSFDVPVEHGAGQRLQLTGQEYTTTDEHGNVSVVVEVLNQLEVVS